MAAFAVWKAPTRLTSSTSVHCSRSSAMVSSRNAIEAMPALAQTMSRRPKCSTPVLSAASSAAKSRTSATAPTILPPAASTMAMVSSSSSRLAMG